VVFEICERTHRQTDTHTQTQWSQYFAPLTRSKQWWESVETYDTTYAVDTITTSTRSFNASKWLSSTSRRANSRRILHHRSRRQQQQQQHLCIIWSQSSRSAAQSAANNTRTCNERSCSGDASTWRWRPFQRVCGNTGWRNTECDVTGDRLSYYIFVTHSGSNNETK